MTGTVDIGRIHESIMVKRELAGLMGFLKSWILWVVESITY